MCQHFLIKVKKNNKKLLNEYQVFFFIFIPTSDGANIIFMYLIATWITIIKQSQVLRFHIWSSTTFSNQFVKSCFLFAIKCKYFHELKGTVKEKWKGE